MQRDAPLRFAPEEGSQSANPPPSSRAGTVGHLGLPIDLSYNEVARTLKISKSVAGKYVSLARAAAVDWEAAQTLTDEELEARLYRPALPRSSQQLARSDPCRRQWH